MFSLLCGGQLDVPPRADQDLAPSSYWLGVPPSSPRRRSPCTVLCSLEAILAMVIFAYTIKEVSEMDLGFAATASGGEFNDEKWKTIQFQ
eukprot:g10882.t1